MNLEKAVPLAILAFSAASLATAYIAQFGFGLEPCILCLYQRVPFYVAGLLALLVLVLPLPKDVKVALVALAGVAFLVNSGIAFYHVGVEQHWWISSCSGEAVTGMSMEQMLMALETRQERPCDDINWTFLGLTMATWNVPYSFGLGAASLLGAWGMRRAS